MTYMWCMQEHVIDRQIQRLDEVHREGLVRSAVVGGRRMICTSCQRDTMWRFATLFGWGCGLRCTMRAVQE